MKKNYIVYLVLVFLALVIVSLYIYTQYLDNFRDSSSNVLTVENAEFVVSAFMDDFVKASPPQFDEEATVRLYEHFSSNLKNEVPFDSMPGGLARKFGVQDIPDNGVNVLSITVDGNTATLVLRLNYSGGVVEREVFMVVESGEWKVENVSLHEEEQVPNKPIGGDIDEGGCIVGAGYTWCEIKNKCLRTWEEPCIADHSQAKVEQYLREHISELSPVEEVLGGTFFITRYVYTDNNIVTVHYEDGHNAYVASVTYTLGNDKINVSKFSLLESNGEVSLENKDAYTTLHEVISQEFGVDLDTTQINQVDVLWNTESGEKKYVGYGSGLSDVAESVQVENLYRSILENLHNRGFTTDVYNALSGSDSFDQTRLKKGTVVCNVFKRVIEEKGFSMEVELMCADFKDSILVMQENWPIVERMIKTCEVEEIMQTHSNTVTVTLKDGTQIIAVQPSIDTVIDLAVKSEDTCGKIFMATE